MTKTIKVKRSENVKDRIEGCVLVPVKNRKDHYPAVASNILPNTYYRVVEDEDRVRAMVTIMPDGLNVAWDTCARCYQHIVRCSCKAGVYHSRSIAWIRATNDVNYPTERVTDYSMYYDPWQRKTDNPIDRTLDDGIGRSPASDISKPKKATASVTQKVTTSAPVEGGLTAKEIENIDMAELHKAASKQAKRTVRRARSVIKGGK